MKCSLCNGEGYHERDCDRKYAIERQSRDGVSAQFTAERFPGSDLLDTMVELKIPEFWITWKDREKLLDEISAVIARYRI